MAQEKLSEVSPSSNIDFGRMFNFIKFSFKIFGKRNQYKAIPLNWPIKVLMVSKTNLFHAKSNGFLNNSPRRFLGIKRKTAVITW